MSDSSLFVTDCPRYVIDLDDQPKNRWTAVITDHLDSLPAMLSLAQNLLGAVGTPIVTAMLRAAAAFGLAAHSDELRGVAEVANMSLGQVILLQLAYEAYAACTSIVTNGANGKPIHIRTMDWDMPDLMPLTIEVDFVKKGKLQYRATTWAGYVGVLTGLRPGVFSVSVNYRRSSKMHENPIRAFAINFLRGLSSKWPVSYVVRYALAKCLSWESAVNVLKSSELIAPVYFTLCGCEHNQGAIVTRGRKRHKISWLTQNQFLVQTNMDNWRADRRSEFSYLYDWQDIAYSRARRKFALQALESLSSKPTMTNLWQLVSVPPCLAYDTVYTTSMDPSNGKITTRVHATAKQRKSGEEKYKDVITKGIEVSKRRERFVFPTKLKFL